MRLLLINPRFNESFWSFKWAVDNRHSSHRAGAGSGFFHLNRLLRRLAPYGDRVFIHVDAKLRELVRIDSSVFHLLLD